LRFLRTLLIILIILLFTLNSFLLDFFFAFNALFLRNNFFNCLRFLSYFFIFFARFFVNFFSPFLCALSLFVTLLISEEIKTANFDFLIVTSFCPFNLDLRTFSFYLSFLSFAFNFLILVLFGFSAFFAFLSCFLIFFILALSFLIAFLVLLCF